MYSFSCELGPNTLLTLQTNRHSNNPNGIDIYTINDEEIFETSRGTLHEWTEFGGVKLVVSPKSAHELYVEVINPATNYGVSTHPLRDAYFDRLGFAPETAAPEYGVMSQGTINMRLGEFNLETDSLMKDYIRRCINKNDRGFNSMVPRDSISQLPFRKSLRKRARWALAAYSLHQLYRTQSLFPHLDYVFTERQYQHTAAYSDLIAR